MRNTFLIGDIINYGFENEIQQIWADVEDEACQAIYLWFCNNLLIYSHKEVLDQGIMERVVAMKKPDQIMAKRIHLEQIQSVLDNYIIKGKLLLGDFREENSINKEEHLWKYGIGTLDDVERIYDFLQSGELAPLYRSREMIEKRIETGEGIHLFIEDQGKIVAHVNSAASTQYSTMIGGLYTTKEFRGQGMARFLLGCLCEEIKEEKKVPCMISAQGTEHNLFYRMGLEVVEEFTTLEPM